MTLEENDEEQVEKLEGLSDIEGGLDTQDETEIDENLISRILFTSKTFITHGMCQLFNQKPTVQSVRNVITFTATFDQAYVNTATFCIYGKEHQA